jgi:hypothetical protein
MVDKATLDEFSLEKKGKMDVNAEDDKIVKLALSKILNETYLAINLESQCVYFRNYMKRIVLSYLFRPSKESHCQASQLQLS